MTSDALLTLVQQFTKEFRAWTEDAVDDSEDGFGGLLTLTGGFVEKAEALLRTSPPPPQKDYPHRCSGCGLRWMTTMPGSVAAELCGDCWRKVQPILHSNSAVGEP